MSVRSTSKRAYEVLMDEGVCGDQRLSVFRSIVSSGKDGITRQEIGEDTELPINAVCGRVNELLKEGRVFEGGETRTNPVSEKQNLIVRAMKYNESYIQAVRRTMGW